MNLLMYSVALIAIALVFYMLVKQMDIKITLFAIGIILMCIAILMGRDIAIAEFEGADSLIIDPLLAVVSVFKDILMGAGFIILILGGFTSYMNHIGANNATVNALLKPIEGVKSQFILVPIIFLIGNLMSLVIPSASNLSIILLATLFPVMKATGMSTLTIAGVIATTATVIPTPLGGDNVAIAENLANYPMFEGLTVTEYVFSYHAIVSIPTLILMAVVHYYWQKYRDSKDGTITQEEINIDTKENNTKEINKSRGYKIVYAFLPILPIFILLIGFILEIFTNINLSLSVEVVTIFSFIVAIVCELARNKNKKEVLEGTQEFFKGMGNSIDIVALLAAASTFVLGLQSIGLIDSLKSIMTNVEGSSADVILPLILVGVTIIIVLISGSGTALFFAMVPLMVPLAQAAGINPVAISVPMGLVGNLMRAVSPVSAVVMIVSGTLKLEPIEVVKRTSVPMISGVILSVILSMVYFI